MTSPGAWCQRKLDFISQVRASGISSSESLLSPPSSGRSNAAFYPLPPFTVPQFTLPRGFQRNFSCHDTHTRKHTLLGYLQWGSEQEEKARRLELMIKSDSVGKTSCSHDRSWDDGAACWRESRMNFVCSSPQMWIKFLVLGLFILSAKIASILYRSVLGIDKVRDLEWETTNRSINNFCQFTKVFLILFTRRPLNISFYP